MLHNVRNVNVISNHLIAHKGYGCTLGCVSIDLPMVIMHYPIERPYIDRIRMYTAGR